MIIKDFRFPVTARIVESNLTTVSAPSKPDLVVAVPPEFHNGLPGRWSPEELLVSAVASCYAVTFAAVAERLDVPVRSASVSGAGHVTRRDDGRFGFVAIELDLRVETDTDKIEDAERAAHRAKELCIVTMALDVPTRIGIDVRAPVQEGAIR
jgi:organic hydroperoxide reductase OsmC/OhrA